MNNKQVEVELISGEISFLRPRRSRLKEWAENIAFILLWVALAYVLFVVFV